jgi:hypothetical protein
VLELTETVLMQDAEAAVVCISLARRLILSSASLFISEYFLVFSKIGIRTTRLNWPRGSRLL